MFRLLMPHSPGKEADCPARFPENQRLEYYPTGGDFFREHRLTLPVSPLPYLRGNKRRNIPCATWKKVKKEFRKTEGNPSACTFRSARSRPPEDGASHPATDACIGCPCAGREKSIQGGIAFLPLHAKNPRGITCLLPMPQSAQKGRLCLADFSRPPECSGISQRNSVGKRMNIHSFRYKKD